MADDKLSKFKTEIKAISEELSLKTEVFSAHKKMPTLIMVSKFDHCLNDLLYRWRKGSLPVDIKGVVSNHVEALDLVEKVGLPFYHIAVTKETKAEAEQTLRETITKTGSELIVLARYMQLVAMGRDIEARVLAKAVTLHAEHRSFLNGRKTVILP